jgi:hypothetical protein
MRERDDSRTLMKPIELGQAVAIIANVGVIVGIAFLAVEIGQTNDQLAAQTRNTMFELRANLERDFINNQGGIAELLGKQTRGDELTDVEIRRLRARQTHVLRSFEYMVLESPNSAQAQAAYMANIFSGDPGLMQTWTFIKSGFDPRFATFLEEYVFPVADQ